MIKIRGVDLHLGYHGNEVVRGASIELEEGKVAALVGPNGSGKSTLLRSLARLHPPMSGDVVLTGADHADDVAASSMSPKDFAKRVTLLAQSRPTPTGISVRDVVGYGRYPYRRRFRSDDTEGPAAIAWAMNVTGVEPMATRCVDELSGGELQRVWLATALAQQTEVLLLDEPTTFLDLHYQVEILDLVRDLADDHNVAVGVVLHDLNQAAEVADHVVLLDNGEVVASGRPLEVLTAENLTRTYGIRVDVEVDSATNVLRTRPIGRHSGQRRELTAPSLSPAP